jgi:uridine phosphorylase
MNAPELPVAWDTTAAPSAFDPADWFAYCEAVTGRATPKLPALAVQTVLPALFELAVERFGAQVDDFTLAEHPFATFSAHSREVVVALSAKGSYATGGLDELVALGARAVVFIGGAGSLVHELPVGGVCVATRALRDDGVSLHYEPPSRYSYPSEQLTDRLAAAAGRRGLEVASGPVWTTTAHFRQSVPRLRAFRDEGCIAVNNEAAAAFSLGRARGVEVAALLPICDSLADDRFVVPPRTSRLYGGEDVAVLLDVALDALTMVGE